MPSIEEAKQRIAVANSESQKLNSIRQQNIGRRETLQKQFETNLKAYNEKFGTSITVETLAAEQERVVAEKIKEVEKVEGVINAINSGNYALANQLSGVKPEEVSTPVEQPVVASPQQTDVSSQSVVISEPQNVSSESQPVMSEQQNVVSGQPFVSTPAQPNPMQQSVIPSPASVGATLVQPNPVVQPSVQTPVSQPVVPSPTPQPTAKPDLASLFSDDDDTSTGGTPLGGVTPSQAQTGLNGALAGFESLGASTTPTPPPVSQSQPNTSFSSLLNNNQFSDL